MFLPRRFDKYTNYNGYICDQRVGAHEVEETRLLNAIAKMQKKYKNPYIRFMWMTREGVEEALCVLYSDVKKNERATKLVTFGEVERIISNDYHCLTNKRKE